MKRNLIALGLLLVLCLGLFSGCRREQDPEPTPTPTPSPSQNLTPPVPSMIITTPAPETTPEVQEFTMTENGEEVTYQGTKVEGQFPDGPQFSWYVDLDAFQINEVDGCCYLIPKNAGDAKIYLELTFRPGATAADLAETILGEYGTMVRTEERDGAKLAGQDPVVRYGETMTEQFYAQLIDVDGGCLTVVTCMPQSGFNAEWVQMMTAAGTLKLS